VGGVTITLTPPDTNATIYYTLDGTLPTTNSMEYTGPFTLTNTATLEANVFENGFVNSVASMASLTIVPVVSFISSGYMANGLFTMALSGPTGQTYVIQSSPDLVNWASIFTNTPGTCPFYATVPTGTNAGAIFYRAIQQP
jgi:hypothetical protein